MHQMPSATSIAHLHLLIQIFSDDEALLTFYAVNGPNYLII